MEIFGLENRKKKFGPENQMIPNLGISLTGLRPWLKCHFLFPLFYISHIYLMNDSNISHTNDNNISHQRFTVVLPYNKSAHSTHWLSSYIFLYNLDENLVIFGKLKHLSPVYTRINTHRIHIDPNKNPFPGVWQSFTTKARGLQRQHTRTCTILQETVNEFLRPLIVFLKSKTHQLTFEGPD